MTIISFQNAVSSSTQTSAPPGTCSTIDVQTPISRRDVETQAPRTPPPSYRDTQTSLHGAETGTGDQIYHTDNIEIPPPPYSVAILMEDWRTNITITDTGPPPDYDTAIRDEGNQLNSYIPTTAVIS